MGCCSSTGAVAHTAKNGDQPVPSLLSGPVARAAKLLEGSFKYEFSECKETESKRLRDHGETQFKEYSVKFNAYLSSKDGIKHGNVVQFAIQVQKKSDRKTYDHNNMIEHSEENSQNSWLCAEGTVASIKGDSVWIIILVDKLLYMSQAETGEIWQAGIGHNDKKSDMPWKVSDKHELGRMLTEMQALEGSFSTSKKIENMSVFRVLTANSFATDLKFFKPQLTGMCMEDLPYRDSAETLLRKWTSLQEFLTETHEFYFLSAARLRSHEGNVKRFQDLVQEPGWLSKRTLSVQDVMQKTYARTILTVSYTWFAPGNPFDPEGCKIQILKDFLMRNKEIEEVWLDFACVPQGQRSPEEQQLFERTLPYINLLYLGTRVLRIVGKDYFERFWPQFEAYLSKQSVHKYGFQNDGPSDTRCTTVYFEGKESDFASHAGFYDSCTYEEAVNRLSDESVKVTNLSDKETCLAKLDQLKEFMACIFNTLDVEPFQRR